MNGKNEKGSKRFIPMIRNLHCRRTLYRILVIFLRLSLVLLLRLVLLLLAGFGPPLMTAIH
jgi:hypothetical protein